MTAGVIQLEADLKVPASFIADISKTVHAILKLHNHVLVSPVAIFSYSNFQGTDEGRFGSFGLFAFPNNAVADSSSAYCFHVQIRLIAASSCKVSRKPKPNSLDMMSLTIIARPLPFVRSGDWPSIVHVWGHRLVDR